MLYNIEKCYIYVIYLTVYSLSDYKIPSLKGNLVRLTLSVWISSSSFQTRINEFLHFNRFSSSQRFRSYLSIKTEQVRNKKLSRWQTQLEYGSNNHPYGPLKPWKATSNERQMPSALSTRIILDTIYSSNGTGKYSNRVTRNNTIKSWKYDWHWKMYRIL